VPEAANAATIWNLVDLQSNRSFAACSSPSPDRSKSRWQPRRLESYPSALPS
jgi:hypothetical protein